MISITSYLKVFGKKYISHNKFWSFQKRTFTYENQCDKQNMFNNTNFNQKRHFIHTPKIKQINSLESILNINNAFLLNPTKELPKISEKDRIHEIDTIKYNLLDMNYSNENIRDYIEKIDNHKKYYENLISKKIINFYGIFGGILVFAFICSGWILMLGNEILTP